MSGQNFNFGGFKLKSKTKQSTSNEKAKLQAIYPLQQQTAVRPSYGSSFSRKHATEEEYFILNF
jgi:hypothetical protein